jgi:hypothetical protein
VCACVCVVRFNSGQVLIYILGGKWGGLIPYPDNDFQRFPYPANVIGCIMETEIQLPLFPFLAI